MLFDIRLDLTYHYDAPVRGGRHLARVTPLNIPGVQRVLSSALSVDPAANQISDSTDFFGNAASAISIVTPHQFLSLRLATRVEVAKRAPPTDISPSLADLGAEIELVRSLETESPHHFRAASPRIAQSLEIGSYAAAVTSETNSTMAAALALCLAIHRDFTYDSNATDVYSTPEQAFILRRGVCQDFAQIMIAGLRAIGIPAGYVSGFLRTNPPPGRPRLEGADAMHAWVRAWCGSALGWIEFDPTNAMLAGADHISIARGRDYADVSPIIGILRTHGSHRTSQSVDVIPLE